MGKIPIRNYIAASVLAVMSFLAVCFGWFPGLELSLQDAIYQTPAPVDPSIKIIAIDEKTLEALGQFETWTREPYAELIDTLNQEGNAPAVIGLDILLVNEKGPEDQTLAQACRRYGNVVLASNLVFSQQIVGSGGSYWTDQTHIAMVEMPVEVLRPYVKTGFVNTVLDPRDDHVRYAMTQREGHLSFAAAVAQRAFPEVALPENGIWIDYTGTPGSYETLSMIDVLEGKIPAEAFRGSIVLVGMQAAGMGDSYLVPSGRGGMMSGVEIHANIVQGILEQRYLTEANTPLNGVFCGIFVFLLTLIGSSLPLWGSVLATAAVCAGQYFLCLAFVGNNLVVNITAVPIAAGLGMAWSVVSRYLVEAMQKRRIVQAFRKYVAPQVVDKIAKNQDYRITLGGEKRHIAVLFVDIRGFTPLCEALTPEQVVEILNDYLELVTKAVFKNNGTLDKFIGDAAMAIFNAPFDSGDYIYDAVCAARDIAAGSEEIARKFAARFGKNVSYGIGVNCGEAIVGNIGAEFRMDYTAIGDTVNTAARLESNAKPGQILISQAVYAALQGRIQASPVGEIPLKGKAQQLMVYELEG